MISTLPTLDFVERRKCSRYHLQLPVLFSWTQEAEANELGSNYRSAGFTRDIGVGGIFVFAQQGPPCGVVEVELVLPLPTESAREIRLRCIGTVLRIENSPSHRGFAVAGDFGCEHYPEFATPDRSDRGDEEWFQ